MHVLTTRNARAKAWEEAVSHATSGRPAGIRATNLFIVRQSGVGDSEGLRSMHERTLRMHMGVPGAQEILKAGIAPLREPFRFPNVVTFSLPKGGSAALWLVDGTYILYVLGSAAMDDMTADLEGSSQNSVAVLFRVVLAALRPVNVNVGPFDRLVRSFANDFYTFDSFKRAGVRLLHHGSNKIDFRSGSAQADWREESGKAIAQHETTVKRTTAGWASLVRDGRWPLSGSMAPPGFTKSDDGRLVVDEAEKRVAALAVTLLAQGLSLSAVARRLVDEGFGARASEQTNVRRIEGLQVPVTRNEDDLDRARRFVRRLLACLPDLAMGKYVQDRRQTLEAQEIHPGARRVDRAGTACYRYLFEVADLFDNVAPALLMAAVERAIRTRLGRSPSQQPMPASEFVEELRARAAAKHILAQGDTETEEYDEVVRWAGLEGCNLDVFDLSASPRQAGIVELVERLELQSMRSVARPPSRQRGSLFLGMPSWTCEDGFEWALRQAAAGNYELMRRRPDPDLLPLASLLRGWAPTSNMVGRGDNFAQFNKLEFHRAVAAAIARAIQDGAPVSPDSFAVAAMLTPVSDDQQIGAALQRQALQDELQQAEKNAAGAAAAVANLFARQLTADDQTSGRVHGVATTTLEALIDRQVAKQLELEGDVTNLRAALDSLDSQPVTPNSGTTASTADTAISDIDVVLDFLRWLAETTYADKDIVDVFHALVVDFTIRPKSSIWLEFSISLRLPHADGFEERIIGPITGEVRARGKLAVGGMGWDEAYAEEFCLRSETVNVGRSDGDGSYTETQAAALRRVRRYLVGLGLSNSAARLVAATPVMELRRIVWERLHGRQIDPVEVGIPPEYVRLIEGTYIPGNDLHGRLGPDVHSRQPLLDALSAAPDKALDRDALADFSPWAGWGTVEKNLRAFLLEPPRGRAQLASYEFEGARSRSTARPIGTFRLLPCPHCSTEQNPSFLDLTVYVPEVRTGLLCSACMHQPDGHGGRFPDAYRDLSRWLVERAAEQAARRGYTAIPRPRTTPGTTLIA